jgi:MFS family permease
MKPRIGVYLSEGMSARLTEAATSPGATKSALVETALDRLLGSGEDLSDTATLARQLAAMSGQLDQLDRNLRIVNETVALHARFHLTVTPLLPVATQEAACALGAERFEVFAAQVDRRVEQGAPLIRETIDRISASKAAAPQDDPEEARFAEPTTCRDNTEDSNEGQATVVPEQFAGASRTTASQAAANLAVNGSLILRVFLPFVTGYYLAYLFRTINAVMASHLATELGLGAGDLGLLTSVYFLTFAAAQIPIGMLLDRYGPRRVQSVLMVVAALGSALFAASENFSMLLLGRALIGLGVAAALTAGMQALVLWFPRERVPLLNGWMVMLGALGAVTATWPAELLLASIGWRELFGLLAALTAVCAIMVHFVVPEAAPITNKAASVGLKKVYTDPRFWRLAPLSASCIGTAWALQGLWAAQWLADVDGLDREGVVQHLFIMAVALSIGAIGLGIAAGRLRRRGIGPETLLGLVATIFVAIQLALILRLSLPSYVLWSGVAATGAATVLSYAILAEYFPKELTGRANGALNLFHIGTAFAVQYTTGIVVQQWIPDAGHYPEVAYQTAFALNVVFQIAAWIWFMMPRALLRPQVMWQPQPSET